MSIFQTSTLCMAILILLAACSGAQKSSKPPDVPKSGKSQDVPKSDRSQDVPKSGRSQDPNRGGSLFSEGISNYEEGAYDLAEKNLKSALSYGLADPDDKLRAHKYLAFIYCMSGRQKLCQREFKKAFLIDPGFTLSPAEAGHPMWQPVYERVKDQMSPAKKSK